MSDLESCTSAELLERLESGDPDAVADAARVLAPREEASVAPRLLELLRTTNDAVLRNAVALALSDLGAPQAFEAIVEVLRDERTRTSRGTLLYALGTYDCSSILPLLVDLVIDGNFEVSRQALGLIHGIEAEIDEAVWNTCTARLRTALVSASRDRALLIAELLALFERSHTDDMDPETTGGTS